MPSNAWGNLLRYTTPAKIGPNSIWSQKRSSISNNFVFQADGTHNAIRKAAFQQKKRGGCFQPPLNLDLTFQRFPRSPPYDVRRMSLERMLSTPVRVMVISADTVSLFRLMRT